MKIAMYRWSDMDLVKEVDDWTENQTEYIRISEPVDVEFTPLSPEVMVPKALAQLDHMEKTLTDKHLKALEAIQTKRKDLLALSPPTLVTSEVA